jgi:copper chaperone CopZ
MLVAMTYQGELFIAVIAGLGLGHGAFNVHAPVAGTDACCVEPAPPTAKQQGGSGGEVKVEARVAAAAVEAAPPVTTVLAVEGMTCDGCTATVVAALAAVPGVEAVQVSLSEGTATVRGAAPPAELRARVVASGHAARVLRDPSVPAGVPVGAEHAGTWRDGDVTCWSRSAAEAAELL